MAQANGTKAASTRRRPTPRGARHVTTLDEWKLSDLVTPGPAMSFSFIDESVTSGLMSGGSYFSFTPGLPPGGKFWNGLPGWYHGRAGNIAFGDGHCEVHKWVEALTCQPMAFNLLESSLPGYASGHLTVKNSVDYDWMQERMPYH